MFAMRVDTAHRIYPAKEERLHLQMDKYFVAGCRIEAVFLSMARDWPTVQK
jgi:hypothetical protein